MMRKFADRIAVVKSGKLVELNNSKDLFENPQSEYTKQLISSIPSI